MIRLKNMVCEEWVDFVKNCPDSFRELALQRGLKHEKISEIIKVINGEEVDENGKERTRTKR